MNRTPFTIQLLYGFSGYRQLVNLGVDAGSKYIGLSATTSKKELFKATVELRQDIPKLLESRGVSAGIVGVSYVIVQPGLIIVDEKENWLPVFSIKLNVI